MLSNRLTTLSSLLATSTVAAASGGCPGAVKAAASPGCPGAKAAGAARVMTATTRSLMRSPAAIPMRSAAADMALAAA
jgi:hypothetical protein